MLKKSNHNTIILFDGVCNFCNSSVNFIIKHDKNNFFKFAALQSEKGKELLKRYNIESERLGSIVLIENGKAFTKSSAALIITKHLNGLYPLLYSFIIIPPFIRNAVYNLIARNRYKWFGKKESCMIPSEKMKEKFMNET